MINRNRLIVEMAEKIAVQHGHRDHGECIEDAKLFYQSVDADPDLAGWDAPEYVLAESEIRLGEESNGEFLGG